MTCTTMSNGAPQEFQSYNSYSFVAMAPPSVPASFPMTIHHDSGGSEKRGRGQEGGQQQQQQQHEQQLHYGHMPSNQAPHQPAHASSEVPLPESLSKRSRSNNYQAPRTVRPSILTAMGSLVGGSNPQTGTRGSIGHDSLATAVPLRRQLSGGILEPFIGCHDNMDTETNDTSRPRSMSF